MVSVVCEQKFWILRCLTFQKLSDKYHQKPKKNVNLEKTSFKYSRTQYYLFK